MDAYHIPFDDYNFSFLSLLEEELQNTAYIQYYPNDRLFSLSPVLLKGPKSYKNEVKTLDIQFFFFIMLRYKALEL